MTAVYSGRRVLAETLKVVVLEEGMKYQPIAPSEAQFLETRKFPLNEMARIFRIPPHRIGNLERSSKQAHSIMTNPTNDCEL